MTAAQGSEVTLRALQGSPLDDAATRAMVIATAQAIAERQGVAITSIRTAPDRITVTLSVGRIEAIGFAAELRRLTTRWYTRKFGAPTLWATRLLLRMTMRVSNGSAPERDASLRDSILKNVERLAVVCPSWIGDTIMATPALRALRSALPNARITGFMRRGLDEVLSGTTSLDQMIVCEMKGMLGPLHMGRAIRAERSQAVVLLPNSFRSALAVRLSGAPIRIGYNRDRRAALLTHKKTVLSTVNPASAVQYYAELAAFALGVDQFEQRIELTTTEPDDRAANKALADVSQPFVLLNPGANRADKRWPAERFAAAADALAASHGLQIVVTGSPGEAAVLQKVAANAKTPIISLATRGLTLGALKSVIRRAACMITNDTGPRHMAAALGTPVVTLFGPTDHRWTTLNCAHEHLLLAEPFLPEELVADRFPKACAIEKISVKDVISAAEGLMRKFPPPREAASGDYNRR